MLAAIEGGGRHPHPDAEGLATPTCGTSRQRCALIWASTSTDQLRAWRGAGGTVVFGTDAGGINDYDPSDEYALMAEAGMTFGEILATLTTTPAAIFGRAATTGRIAPGQPADLVVLDGDPSQNVRVLADVRYTLRDGSVVYP